MPNPWGRDEEGQGRPAASFLSDRLADDWWFGEPARTGTSVSGTINRFSPRKVSPEAWSRVEAVVKQAVTQVGFSDPDLAKHALSIVAQFTLWADRVGQSVDVEALFDPELIDRFITEGCAHLSEGTRLNYRTQLWRVGTAVVGHGLFPPRSVPLKASAVRRPYTTAEITELASWSRGLPTESMRRNSRALIAIGLGTGMRPPEIARAIGTDVREKGELVLVDVIGSGGRTDRTIPVLRPWAGEVLELARESGGRPYFRADRTRILRNDIIGFVRRCSPEGPPKFNMERLRITWIVSQLTAGTHLTALQLASGVGVAQLVKYLPFAAPLDEARARRALAGEA